MVVALVQDEEAGGYDWEDMEAQLHKVHLVTEQGNACEHNEELKHYAD